MSDVSDTFSNGVLAAVALLQKHRTAALRDRDILPRETIPWRYYDAQYTVLEDLLGDLEDLLEDSQKASSSTRRDR